jgi:hypothetical protein
MASAHAITDHDEIREWAEQRGARPACVTGTGRKGDTGMIRGFPRLQRRRLAAVVLVGRLVQAVRRQRSCAARAGLNEPRPAEQLQQAGEPRHGGHPWRTLGAEHETLGPEHLPPLIRVSVASEVCAQ